MSSAWYHIIVVGEDLPGLIYAALAACQGYRVAVLGHGARPGTERHRGLVLPRVLAPMMGLTASPVVRQVFGELSLHLALRNRPQPVNPPLQFITPDLRLNIPEDPILFARELDRELPITGDILSAFEPWAADLTAATDPWLRAEALHQPPGLGTSTRMRRLVQDHPDAVIPSVPGAGPLRSAPGGAAIRALVSAVAGHFSDLSTAAATPILAARAWTHLRAGVGRFPGGLDALKKMLLARVREQCGDHRETGSLEGVILRRGRVAEVVLADRAEHIACELVVINSTNPDLLGRIPSNSNASLIPPPVRWRMVTHLAVDPRVLPKGMGSEVLMVADPAAPLTGDNALWLSQTDDPGVLSASTIIAPRGLAPTLQGVRNQERASVARIADTIPWLHGHLRFTHTPALTDDPGRLSLAALEPIFAGPQPMTLGASAIRPQCGVKNILIATDALFGGMGFEGGCVGALQLLDRTRRLVRLKTPIQRGGLPL